MKRFFLDILMWVIVPLLCVIGLYVWVDPFQMVQPFSLSYFLEKSLGETNREYFSIKLFEQQKQYRNYDSFIFGSSRTSAFNPYHWKSRLDSADNVFVFTSWRENITGIAEKLAYLDASGVEINNCLIVLDCGEAYSFNSSEGAAPLTNHYYQVSGQSRLRYYWNYFYAFIARPTKMIEFTMSRDRKVVDLNNLSIDTISNTDVGYAQMIEPDYPTEIRVHDIQPSAETELPALLTDKLKEDLNKIYAVLKKHGSDYRIMVVPNFYKERVNRKDLRYIQDVFGEDSVCDFSGEQTEYTTPIFYNDVEHFNSYVGWQLIERMF